MTDEREANQRRADMEGLYRVMMRHAHRYDGRELAALGGLVADEARAMIEAGVQVPLPPADHPPLTAAWLEAVMGKLVERILLGEPGGQAEDARRVHVHVDDATFSARLRALCGYSPRHKSGAFLSRHPEFSQVSLAVPVEADGRLFPRGSTGTVVHVHPDGNAYEVEFQSPTQVVTVEAADLADEPPGT